MTIVEFLEARLMEDEAVAREAITPNRPGTHWEWESPADHDDPESPRWLRTVEEFPTKSGVGDLPGFPLHGCTVDPSPAMDHIVRHDPARVLREVTAKRSILVEHNDDEGQCARCLDSDGIIYLGAYTAPWPCPTLRALSVIYSDHPDYRKEWAL